MKWEKRGIYLVFFVLMSLSVFAQTFKPVFDLFKDFNPVQLYTDMPQLIDFVILLLIFYSLSKVAFERFAGFSNGQLNESRMLPMAIAIVLAGSGTWYIHQMAKLGGLFPLLGKFAFSIPLLIAAVLLYQVVKGLGTKVETGWILSLTISLIGFYMSSVFYDAINGLDGNILGAPMSGWIHLIGPGFLLIAGALVAFSLFMKGGKKLAGFAGEKLEQRKQNSSSGNGPRPPDDTFTESLQAPLASIKAASKEEKAAVEKSQEKLKEEEKDVAKAQATLEGVKKALDKTDPKGFQTAMFQKAVQQLLDLEKHTSKVEAEWDQMSKAIGGRVAQSRQWIEQANALEAQAQNDPALAQKVLKLRPITVQVMTLANEIGMVWADCHQKADGLLKQENAYRSILQSVANAPNLDAAKQGISQAMESEKEVKKYVQYIKDRYSGINKNLDALLAHEQQIENVLK